MNIGFPLSILAGFIWSLVNVIDKTVVSKFIRNPIFVVLILNVVALITGIIILVVIQQTMIGWSWFWIFLSGILCTFGCLFYFYALKIEEASRIIPLFSLITVFIVILSATFLGEIFNFLKYLGIFIIVLGSIIITSRRNIFSAFISRALGLMILSGLGFGASSVINKYLLVDYNYWTVFGYHRLFLGLSGFFIISIYFKEIKKLFLELKKRYILLMSSGEILGTGADLIFLMATAFWYVSLASAVVSVQYIFIFIWALIISRFKPSLFSEVVNRRVIFQKVIAIVLIVGGIFLIS